MRIRSHIVCAGLDNGVVQVWDCDSLSCKTFLHSPLPIRGVDVHRDLRHVVSAGDDWKIKIWDSTPDLSAPGNSNGKERPVTTFLDHLGIVRSVEFHPEKQNGFLVSGSDDQTVRVWSFSLDPSTIHKKTSLRTLTGHNHHVTCAVFHPTEELIASSSVDQTLIIWERRNEYWPRKYVLSGHTNAIRSVKFHSTLPLLISSGDDCRVKVWRMSQRKAWEVRSLEGHTIGVPGCVFAEDIGLSCGEDGAIRVWNIRRRSLCTIVLEKDKSQTETRSILANQPPCITSIGIDPKRCDRLAVAHDGGLLVWNISKIYEDPTAHGNRLAVEEKNSSPFYTYPPELMSSRPREIAEFNISLSSEKSITRDRYYDETGIGLEKERTKKLERNQLLKLRISCLLCPTMVAALLFLSYGYNFAFAVLVSILVGAFGFLRWLKRATHITVHRNDQEDMVELV